MLRTQTVQNNTHTFNFKLENCTVLNEAVGLKKYKIKIIISDLEICRTGIKIKPTTELLFFYNDLETACRKFYGYVKKLPLQYS